MKTAWPEQRDRDTRAGPAKNIPSHRRSYEVVRAACEHPLYDEKKFLEWLEESDELLKTLLTRHFRGF
jgi:hypothetical protein